MPKALSKVSLCIALILLTSTAWFAAAQDSTAPMGVGPVRIKSGVRVMLNLDTAVNSATARIDDELWFTVRDDVKVDGLVALPRGAPVRGRVIAVRPATVNGKNQRTELQIRLVEIPLAADGTVELATNALRVRGEKTGQGAASTAQTAVGSAAQGAMLGGMITRSAKGAGIGAVAGVGVGMLGSVLQSRGPTSDVDLPSGSVFEARLEKPLNIPDPISLAKAVPRPSAPTTPNGAPSSPGDAATAVSAANVSPAESPSVPNETPQRGVPKFDTLPSNEGAPASTDASSSTSGVAATPPPAVLTPASLSVDVNLVQVDAVVRDRTGKPMSNLRQEDFRVLEDGVEQRIQFFSRDSLPMAVALVIDRSGSVAPLMGTVQSAAYQALQLLKAGDEVCLFTFAGDVEMLEELTPNRQRVANRIGGIRAGGGTAIVDGVSDALRYLDTAAHDRRRAVILISDNIEGHSHTPVDRAIEFALESEAVVYSVKVGAGVGGGGIFGLPGIPGISRLPGVGSSDPVHEITRETGGEIFDATSGVSIAAALTTAVDRLKMRYTLSYASEKSGPARTGKGGYHRIQVQLASRFGKVDTDYSIHSRSGYYDPQSTTNPAETRP